MTITSYSELQTAIENWLQDSTLGARVPEFIALAEARLRRILPVTENEMTTALVLASDEVALPSGFQQLRAIYLDTDPRAPLQQMTLAALRTFYAAQTTGRPECFAISGTTLILGPAPDATYTANITYLAELTPLSDSAPSNWLLASHPDIYLLQSLLQAEFFGWNDDRLPTIKAGVDEAISELTDASLRKRYSSAPLRLRAPVIEVL